ncbi:amino acid adenylation domain-containing protein [Tsukamurella sp. 8F]|uniref:non-ribosomal peptide synthetase n=1 Tax=unclassified Tsukamurella TaxID=2633480 RepID=UPI0023B93400|nr:MULTISPECIES: non-ribosomal peptide synthetase [unclassified Tsukamurella]MDF0529307.1 amino acid adenylation domain-containing protein [Tsukamurella sp. 8J]MDF0587186.1 amino acid adenylation domain-containing protein [Tsukamurella sp. 8F]
MTANLTAAHRELLERRLREQGLKAAADTGRVERLAGGSPLSPAQRRLWFVAQRDPAGTVLTISVAYRLDGALDPGRLRSAFDAVVARHEVLRTTYHVGPDGEPVQRIGSGGVEWEQTSALGLGEGERHRRVSVLARRAAARPFDLERDAMLRVHLVDVSDARADGTDGSRHVLLLTLHHICFDDLSWPLLFEDLSAAYSGTSLPDLSPQYLDATAPVATSALADDVRHWVDRLTPVPTPVALPGDLGAGEIDSRAIRSGLPDGLDGRVETVARELGVTPFSVYLAGFASLVRRYFGTDDFTVSVPVTDRPAGAEGLIGYFGNTLVRRVTVDLDEPFADLVRRIQGDGAEDLAHAGAGIDAVVAELDVARGGEDAFTRLVQLSFSTRSHTGGPTLGDVVATPLELTAPLAQVPFEATLVSTPSGADLETRYHHGRIDPRVAEGFGRSFPVLLESALGAPTTTLRLLPVRDSAMPRAQVWGPGTPDVPTTLSGLLDRAIAEHPHSIAVISERDGSTVELTYSELGERARRLARYLAAKGIGPGDIVALQQRGSEGFLVSAVAVLAAGAAYLPVDPAYPAQRIEYLHADAKPALTLDDEALAAAELDAEGLDACPLTDTDRTAPLLPGTLAYVIYTSGSTGDPKGVAVEHGAIADHLAGHVLQESLTPDDRLLLTSSVSFDASVFEIFTTLTLGATLVIPTDAKDFGAVSDLVQRHRVTVVHMVPSALSTHLLLPGIEKWRSVRWVPVGGEALPGDAADRFAAVRGAVLTNNYGPTEAVVAASRYVVDRPQGHRTVPIGGPTPGVALYLLDEALAPVPDGAAGEIYIGGDQLARGYLRDPARTAGRFIADPFRSGARMYRTGDRARRDSEGQLEFLGRTDEQVKIHGFRIEPGEIRNALLGHSDVADAAVIARTDDASGPYLAAYLVGAPDVARVRAYLAERLPAHMVPAAFVVIDRIPLGPNGKIAPAALPRPDRSVAADERGRAPATRAERAVAALFAELLGIDDVTAEDSFFERGGHSLLATRLVALLRRDSGVALPVRAVFDAPTVESLAALVERAADGGDTDSALPPVRPAQTRPDTIPLTASQRSVWFAHVMSGAAAATTGETVAAGTIEVAIALEGEVDADELEAALGDVVARHESLRTVLEQGEGADGVPVARVLGDRMVELERVTAADVTAMRAELARRPFELLGGNLLRAALIAPVQGEPVLQLLVHHVVVDHASFAVILDDLYAAYRARVGGLETNDPAPPQFPDYALWQADVFGSATGRREVEHWVSALSGLPAEIPAGHDHARRLTHAFAPGHRAHFTVSAKTRNLLHAWGDRNGATEFMIGQAALAVLLHRHGGGTDIAVGTPAAGRIDAATESMVGLLANMVALRTRVSPDSTLDDVLAAARSAALDAFSHQAAPFELVVDALGPPRLPGRNPVFQTMLHVRDDAAALAPVPVSDRLTARGLPSDFDVALVDLSVSLFAASDGGWDGMVIASPTVYQADTADRLAAGMLAVLEAMASGETATVGGLDLPDLGSPHAAEAAEAARVVAEGSAETAARLIALLEELLGLDGIESGDGFFAVGGDSVTSLQWAARAAAEGLPLTPQMVFECATIGELAAAVDAAAAGDEVDHPPVAEPAQPSAPMSASGLGADQLAALRAAWKGDA